MDTLTYALGLVLIGAHITVFAVSAKVFGTQEGFLPPNPAFERLFQYLTLETGLLFGCLLLLLGAGILGYAFYLWHAAGFGNLSATRMLRLTLPSAALLHARRRSHLRQLLPLPARPQPPLARAKALIRAQKRP